MNDEQQMRRFEERLTDRFGALPDAARSLMDVVRLRWRAVALGFEWVKVKNAHAAALHLRQRISVL